MERVSGSHSIWTNFPRASRKARETTTRRGRRGFGLTECIGQEVEDPCSNPDPTRHVFMSCSWDTQNVNMQHTTQTAMDQQDEFSLFSEFGLKIYHLKMQRTHKQLEIQRLVDWKKMNHFHFFNIFRFQLPKCLFFFTNESKWRVFRLWSVGWVKEAIWGHRFRFLGHLSIFQILRRKQWNRLLVKIISRLVGGENDR